MNHKQFIENFKGRTFFRKDDKNEYFKYIDYEEMSELRGYVKVLTSKTTIDKLVVSEDWKDVYQTKNYNEPLCHCNNCNTSSIFSYDSSETRGDVSYDIYKCPTCNSLIWNYVESNDDVVIINNTTKNESEWRNNLP